MKVLVGAFNQEKALVGAFSVIVQPVVEPMEHYTALHVTLSGQVPRPRPLPRHRRRYSPATSIPCSCSYLPFPRIICNECCFLFTVRWTGDNVLQRTITARTFTVKCTNAFKNHIVKLRQGSGKDRKVFALKAKGLKA